MKVEINETYVKCDICGEKIDHRIFYSHIHQMKVKKKGRKKRLKMLVRNRYVSCLLRQVCKTDT